MSGVSSITDELDGVVRVHLEGKERKLRYDLAAQAHLCDVLTLTDITSLLAAFQNVEGATLPLFLHAGLMWDEPDLTLEQVSKWFVPFLPTVNAIQRATSLAMFGPEGPPEAEETEGEEDPPMPVNL